MRTATNWLGTGELRDIATAVQKVSDFYDKINTGDTSVAFPIDGFVVLDSTGEEVGVISRTDDEYMAFFASVED